MGKRTGPLLAITDEAEKPFGGPYKGRCFYHWCPGCKSTHMINVEAPNEGGHVWAFNENLNAPTFTPSVNIVGRCHYNITDGNILFHGDSAHELKGQTMPLPPIPAGWIDGDPE